MLEVVEKASNLIPLGNPRKQHYYVGAHLRSSPRTNTTLRMYATETIAMALLHSRTILANQTYHVRSEVHTWKMGGPD